MTNGNVKGAVSLQAIICTLSSAICHLYSVHFLPLSQGEYHEVGRGYDVSFTFRFPLSVFPFPFTSYPLPLRVLPLSQGEKASGHLKPESPTTNFVPLT